MVSEETRRKISESRKGKKLSEETKKKIGIANKGRITSKETRKKLSETKKGKHNSEEHNLNISKGRKGKGFVKFAEESPGWKGGSIEIICDYCGKKIIRKQFYKGRNKNNFCNTTCYGEWRSQNIVGDKHFGWKGPGNCVTPENKRLRRSIEFRLWREAVFARDNWTCQECGKRGSVLNAHHIKKFSEYPELRTSINNGITLCGTCHRKLHREAA